MKKLIAILKEKNKKPKKKTNTRRAERYTWTGDMIKVTKF